PEPLFAQLPEELSKRPSAAVNILVCHHHPVEIELPSEDKSVITNGPELIDLLTKLAPPGWLILHGHRHLPCLKYAAASQNAPVIFSAGSLSANLHLNIQGRAANQFYSLEVEGTRTGVMGRYDAWTWDQHEGDW